VLEIDPGAVDLSNKLGIDLDPNHSILTRAQRIIHSNTVQDINIRFKKRNY
jgi:hypothetical protein